MKIIEFGKEEREGPAKRMKILEFDRGEGIERARPAPAVPRPSGAAAPAAQRRTLSVRSPAAALRMHVLDLGKLRLDKNFMVANAVVATQKDPNPQGRLIDIPVSAYLIEHPDGNVLFDTGCNPQWGGPDGRWPEHLQDVLPVIGGEECMLPARLDALGIGPDQIRYVVLSHLHCDHAGCVEFFRKSELLVHEDEFSGALRRYALHDHSTPYVWKDIDRWTHLDLRWRLIGRREPDQAVVEGVRLLNFGSGHAHGMLGLQVSLRSEPGVLLVSDACYTAENYGPPMRLPGFLYDSLGFLRTLERIRVLARESGCSVWFGHDAAQFETLRKSTEGFYE